MRKSLQLGELLPIYRPLPFLLLTPVRLLGTTTMVAPCPRQGLSSPGGTQLNEKFRAALLIEP